jgi:hypothetical protein
MAAIAVNVSLEGLRKFVPQFVNATYKEIADELKRQARLLLRDSGGTGLLSITPPQGLGSDAEEIGNRSVRSDIEKVFVSAAALIGAVGSVGRRGDREALKNYLKNNDYQGAKEFLNSQTPSTIQVRGYSAKRRGKVVNVKPYTQKRDVSALNIPRLGRVEVVAPDPFASLHKTRRRKAGQNQGRVIRQSWAQVVLKKTSLNQYIKDRQRRVGLLKAGWARAAKEAGIDVSIPRFIGRNIGAAQGSGSKNILFANPMTIELTNSFDAASSKIKKENIQFLVRLRQENIIREMVNRMNGLAKKI